MTPEQTLRGERVPDRAFRLKQLDFTPDWTRRSALTVLVLDALLELLEQPVLVRHVLPQTLRLAPQRLHLFVLFLHESSRYYKQIRA